MHRTRIRYSPAVHRINLGGFLTALAFLVGESLGLSEEAESYAVFGLVALAWFIAWYAYKDDTRTVIRS